MATTDQDVNSWFDQNLIRYMGNDIGAAISGHANFGAALMLLCYTEVLGGVSTGKLTMSGNVRDNFNAGLAMLDVAAAADGSGPRYYTNFAVKLNGTVSSLYEVLRCGMVHEFFGKGAIPVANDPSDPTGLSRPGATGVRWDGAVLVFDVNAYFKHFQTAVRNLLASVLADTASTGPRAEFDRILAALSSKKVTP